MALKCIHFQRSAIGGGGASRHGVVGGGGIGGRSLEVGADVHSSRSKKFSLSSETVSMSIGDNASTKALAGSILAYRYEVCYPRERARRASEQRVLALNPVSSVLFSQKWLD